MCVLLLRTHSMISIASDAPQRHLGNKPRDCKMFASTVAKSRETKSRKSAASVDQYSSAISVKGSVLSMRPTRRMRTRSPRVASEHKERHARVDAGRSTHARRKRSLSADAGAPRTALLRCVIRTRLSHMCDSVSEYVIS